MTKNEILEKVKEIKRLEETKGEPFKNVKLKTLKEPLLQEVLGKQGNILKVGDFVVRVSFREKNLEQPYIQIYTKESYQKYLDFYSLKEVKKTEQN